MSSVTFAPVDSDVTRSAASKLASCTYHVGAYPADGASGARGFATCFASDVIKARGPRAGKTQCRGTANSWEPLM